MEHKLVITKYRLAEAQKGILTALYENGKLAELHYEEEEQETLLGQVFIGKVKDVVPNIQAAFVEIGKGIPCYFSFEDNKHPVYTDRKGKKGIVPGDELLVQVSKENIKTKAPTVTSNLNFPGKYLVLTTGNRKLGISGKIQGNKREELKELLVPKLKEEYGFVIRTNAADADKQEILEEAEKLIAAYKKMKATASYRTCYSCLYKPPSPYLVDLRNTYTRYLTEIITDDEDLYQELALFLKSEQPKDQDKLKLYADRDYPLIKLYSLETELKQALRPRVWLKSGGYLMIEPTEAFTVIDVNTGKFNGRKKIQETFLKINLEAAKEIARQMRIRNLSGIILIDFIDLKEKEDEEQLIQTFEKYISKDPVKTICVGMTRLKIMEVTRKKIRKPLREQMYE